MTSSPFFVIIASPSSSSPSRALPPHRHREPEGRGDPYKSWIPGQARNEDIIDSHTIVTPDLIRGLLLIMFLFFFS